MTQPDQTFDELVLRLRNAALLGSAAAVLGWDEQTYLPPGGGAHRAEQLGLLAGLAHQQATDPAIGELLDRCESSKEFDADGEEAALIREARRDYDRKVRLPRRLVEDLSRVTTLAQQAWVAARKNKSFGEFQPWLKRVVDLKREQADAVRGDGNGSRYDALLDDYEPGATSESIAAMFGELRAELVRLLGEIRDSGVRPDVSILKRSYPIESQRAFGRAAAAAIGFDFHRGRIDEAAHPFCSGIGPGDCRLTTRYDEHFFPQAFFGTLHEAGHGLYEQGLPPERFGTPLGEACSLGIHESQSRMWENLVGRSRAFWEHFFPQARQAFPGVLKEVDSTAFHRAVNDVRPSFIRVEADEVTYNLHIMLRFELERAMIDGALETEGVEAAWNEAFTRDFGMTPPDAAFGCLQDIHWGAGLIGYFPTYTLGNLYASQMFDAAEREIGPLAEQFTNGEFRPLKDWLIERVHRHGRRFAPGRLVRNVTGEAPSHHPLVAHLDAKFREIYRV